MAAEHAPEPPQPSPGGRHRDPAPTTAEDPASNAGPRWAAGVVTAGGLVDAEQTTGTGAHCAPTGVRHGEDTYSATVTELGFDPGRARNHEPLSASTPRRADVDLHYVPPPLPPPTLRGERAEEVLAEVRALQALITGRSPDPVRPTVMGVAAPLVGMAPPVVEEAPAPRSAEPDAAAADVESAGLPEVPPLPPVHGYEEVTAGDHPTVAYEISGRRAHRVPGIAAAAEAPPAAREDSLPEVEPGEPVDTASPGRVVADDPASAEDAVDAADAAPVADDTWLREVDMPRLPSLPRIRQ